MARTGRIPPKCLGGPKGAISATLWGCLGGVLLGGAGLLPVALQHGFGGQTYVVFTDHFVYPHQLLQAGWGNGPSIAGPYDTLTFQLGLIACGLATLGIVLGNKPLTDDRHVGA